ncbi:hypothetical protein GOP47_0002527 [Adiantum capillus-veneris]|uniref:Uncharacterized protein n=1 Tax=Adiantum capillus-veneris TaxID=13818 RepID=A0A9D4VAI5_ADICA|nr:hypothetical protein GOP47_0002527 [Adiantum capillus-veneris]
MLELVFSTNRLVHRWILQCVEEGRLGEISELTREWVDVDDESTMYSPSLLEKNMTPWEARLCPWWIDYLIGVIPKQEKDLHERFKQETHSNKELDALTTPSSMEHQVNEGSDEIEASKNATKVTQGKGFMEPPSTSSEPKWMNAVEVSLAPTTSFVAESSLGRESRERRSMTRSVGFQYQTFIDALLVDVTQIDRFALISINKFFATQKTHLYSKDGVPCREVARLIFADFPTGLLVDALGPIPWEGMTIPKWNTFSPEVDGEIVRGGAERTSVFFWLLLATFTERCDYVLDVFAGCGDLGKASVEDLRHCICLELDDVLYE